MGIGNQIATRDRMQEYLGFRDALRELISQVDWDVKHYNTNNFWMANPAKAPDLMDLIDDNLEQVVG